MNTRFKGQLSPLDSPMVGRPSHLQIQVIKDAYAETNLSSVMSINDSGVIAFRPEHAIIEHSFSTTGTGLAEELAYVVAAADEVGVELVSTPLMCMSDETGLTIFHVAAGDVFIDTLVFGDGYDVIDCRHDVLVEPTDR